VLFVGLKSGKLGGSEKKCLVELENGRQSASEFEEEGVWLRGNRLPTILEIK
jgi:hypothetical protein